VLLSVVGCRELELGTPENSPLKYSLPMSCIETTRSLGAVFHHQLQLDYPPVKESRSAISQAFVLTAKAMTMIAASVSEVRSFELTGEMKTPLRVFWLLEQEPIKLALGVLSAEDVGFVTVDGGGPSW
jgi:hypothetical protein